MFDARRLATQTAWLAGLLAGCGEELEFRIAQTYMLPCTDTRCAGTVALIAHADFVRTRPAIGEGEAERIQGVAARVLGSSIPVAIAGAAIGARLAPVSAELVSRANNQLIFHHEDLEGMVEAVVVEPAAMVTLSVEYELVLTRDTASFIP